MISSWPFHELVKACSWVVHDLIMSCSCLVHDLFITCSRLALELFMSCAWLLHYSWFVYDLFMTCLWLIHDGNILLHILYLTIQLFVYFVIWLGLMAQEIFLQVNNGLECCFSPAVNFNFNTNLQRNDKMASFQWYYLKIPLNVSHFDKSFLLKSQLIKATNNVICLEGGRGDRCHSVLFPGTSGVRCNKISSYILGVISWFSFSRCLLFFLS